MSNLLTNKISSKLAETNQLYKRIIILRVTGLDRISMLFHSPVSGREKNVLNNSIFQKTTTSTEEQVDNCTSGYAKTEF